MAKDGETLPAGVRESVESKPRRDVLAALQVMDSKSDPDFDRLTRLAAGIFGAPVSLVTLLDADRQWFKSRQGTELTETPINISFCAHAIAAKPDKALVVLDMTGDERFAANPLVTGSEHVRFYAGAPITVQGERLGTLCVLDRNPRQAVNEQQIDQLIDLAAIAGTLFELKDEARVRARTAAELIKEEWRHALTLEAGKVGSWVWDIRTGDVVVNDILRRMYGLPAGRSVSIDDMFGAVDQHDRPAMDAAIAATFEQGLDYVSEFRVEGGRWLIARGRVYQRDAAGKPLIMMGVNVDITEAREAADQTRRLLRELNHRVKNTLAMIQSLARQTLRRTSDPEQFIDAFSGRLRTLAEAHVLLSDRDWSGISLKEVVAHQVSPYALATPPQVMVSGEDFNLPPDHALGLGLILHELASNAIKYGALSVPSGRVLIGWKEVGDAEHRRIELDWTESHGPKVAAPGDLGFGGRLIERSLDKVLESSVKLNFAETGVEARISFPLD